MARQVRTDFTVFYKTDEEVAIKEIDFSGQDTAEGEVISDVVKVEISPTTTPPLVVDGSSSLGLVVQLTISGGKIDTTYHVNVMIETNLGQRLEGGGILAIGNP